jgi:hypothetical protein
MIFHGAGNYPGLLKSKRHIIGNRRDTSEGIA